MGNIFIVRHGQNVDNAERVLNSALDRPLTELGREQAKTVASKLQAHNINIIYSSPLKRALQTAQIIAEELGINDVIVYDDLTERDFGILAGRPVTDIPKYATKILHSDGIMYFLEAKGAESFANLYKRAKRVLIDVQQKHPNENVLLVAHGDIGKMIRAVYHGWTWKKGLKTPYFDNTETLELAPLKDHLE